MKKLFTTIVYLTPPHRAITKNFISTLALVLIYFVGFAQSATDEKAVRAVIQKMDDAWNAHDYSYSGKYDFYAQDATLVNPVGMYWKNRAEIIKAHKVYGKTMFKFTSARSQTEKVRFVAPSVVQAIVKTQYRVEQDYNFPDGTKAGSKGDIEYSMMDIVFTKQNGAWKIASQQVTRIDPKVQAQDPVK